MTMKDKPMNKTHQWLRPLALLALASPLSGCISLSSPEKPIEINLNVTIRQEVLVRLQRDVDTLINQNPEVFPQQQPRQ